MSESHNEAGTESAAPVKDEGKSFSQADVDRIVQERLVQQAKNKFGDYDELKSRAGAAATAEERIAELEKRYADAEAARLRSDVAAKFGLSAEDRDLFLIGSDEATLTAQAERLAARESDRKKQGNVAPNEGNAKNTGDRQDDDMREFARSLFGSTD